MDYYFSVEHIRSELIKHLQKNGMSEEKINEFIKICDEMYEEHKVPYPKVEELDKIEWE